LLLRGLLLFLKNFSVFPFFFLYFAFFSILFKTGLKYFIFHVFSLFLFSIPFFLSRAFLREKQTYWSFSYFLFFISNRDFTSSIISKI